MAGGAHASGSQDEVVRPFQCPQCGSRYTRQEHLSRHQQARHSDIKEFVCAICNKGFARRDILRRHEQGHAKKAEAEEAKLHRTIKGKKAAGSSAASRKRESDIDMVDSPPPAKAPRTSKACLRCSKSKLRCDGEQPCGRCRKVGADCSFDRDMSMGAQDLINVGAGPGGRSKSPSSRSEEGSPSMIGDSPEDDLLYGGDHQQQLMAAAAAAAGGAAGWGSQQQQVPPLPNISPYAMPIRPSPLHPGHALPPASFQQQPMQIGSPGGHHSYYSASRPPDPFAAYRSHSPYPVSYGGVPGTSSTPYSNASSSNSNSHPLPPLPGQMHHPQPQHPHHPHQHPHSASHAGTPPIPSSPWDTAAYGRASTGTGDPGHGHVDFLDLIANNATSSNESSDIDWALLNSGYTPRTTNDGFTPQGQSHDQGGVNGMSGGEHDLRHHHHGHDEDADNFAAAAAITSMNSPGASASEVEAALLGVNGATMGGGGNSIQQQSSSLRQSLVDDDDDGGRDGRHDGHQFGGLDSFPSGSMTPLLQHQRQQQQQQQQQAGETAPVSSATSLAHESVSSLSIQGSAAETLLQLASHTPRASPEPEHRTSHPIHNLADPWPLSYRPTEKTERLDKGASRAASPRPGYQLVNTSLNGAQQHNSNLKLVPPVNPTTRARVLDKVRHIHEPDARFVPRLELLDLFVQLYFDKFATLLPMIHRPSFDPNTCPSFLVLAVASVGARYAGDRVQGAKMHAQALMEIARKMLNIVGDFDNTLMRTVAWQQALMLVLFTGLSIGHKRSLELTQAHSSMPVTFARRQGWFRESKIDENHERTFSLEERWKRWRDREEIKRLGFAALAFDSMGTALWNHESSSLYLDAAKTSLPCHDALWDAPTAVAWQNLFRGSFLPEPSLDTLSAITQATNRTTHGAEPLLRISRDAFATTVIVCILHCLGWSNSHETTVTQLFLPSVALGERNSEPVKKALEAGLEFFQDRVVLPPEMQAAMPDMSANASTISLMLHLTAITQRLPLRVLQPLARTGDWAPSSDILDAVHKWAREEYGTTARWTAYHAGQLFALVRQPGDETPLEPFALFYATLVLLAFVRESANGTILNHGGIGIGIKQEDGALNGNGGGQTASTTRIRLDRLADRSNADLSSWLHGTSSTPISATLDEPVGDLASPGAGIRLLRVAAKELIALRVWRVGELLGRTLIELANEEERKAGGGQYGDGGI